MRQKQIVITVRSGLIGWGEGGNDTAESQNHKPQTPNSETWLPPQASERLLLLLLLLLLRAHVRDDDDPLHQHLRSSPARGLTH